MKTFLFAYGTLIDPAIARAVIGREPKGQAAWVWGYRRWCVLAANYPALVRGGSRCVAGWLYEGISPQEWQRLDLYEGSEFVRRRISVRRADGQRMSCYAYLWRREQDNKLVARPWVPPRGRWFSR